MAPPTVESAHTRLSQLKRAEDSVEEASRQLEHVFERMHGLFLAAGARTAEIALREMEEARTLIHLERARQKRILADLTR